jgi:hypothetical protein
VLVIERLPASIRGSFLAAGWRPGRRLAVSPAVKTDHPACAILAEFDGLRIGQVGLGEECGTSDVVFQLLWPDDKIRVWGKLLATQLVGVAEVHHDHEELFVDDHYRFLGPVSSTTRSTSTGHRSGRLWSAFSWAGGLNQCCDQTKTA